MLHLLVTYHKVYCAKLAACSHLHHQNEGIPNPALQAPGSIDAEANPEECEPAGDLAS